LSLLTKPITIFSHRYKRADSRIQAGILAQDNRVRSYYEAVTDNGTVIARFYLGLGIEVPGQNELWRILKQPKMESLVPPGRSASDPASNLFKGSTNLFGRVCRITQGQDRLGGYILEGNGWRGSRIRRVNDGVRVANVYAEGDPPEIFHVDPARSVPEIPLTSVFLIIHFLLEREIRHGSEVKRPTPTVEIPSSTAEPASPPVERTMLTFEPVDLD
jgi:hypothetical protein